MQVARSIQHSGINSEILMIALPPETKQYIRRQIGRHMGTVKHLIPFNFTYDEEAINNASRRALNGKEPPQSLSESTDNAISWIFSRDVLLCLVNMPLCPVYLY